MFKWQSYSFKFPINKEDNDTTTLPGFPDGHLRIERPLWGDDLQFYNIWDRVDLHHSKYPDIHLALPTGSYSADDFAKIYDDIQTTHTALFNTINDFFIRHGHVIVLLYPLNSAFMKDDGNIFMLQSLLGNEKTARPDLRLQRTDSLEHLNIESDEDMIGQSVVDDLLFSSSSYASSEDLFGINGSNSHLDNVLSNMLKDCVLDGTNDQSWCELTDTSSEDTQEVEPAQQFGRTYSPLKAMFEQNK